MSASNNNDNTPYSYKTSDRATVVLRAKDNKGQWACLQGPAIRTDTGVIIQGKFHRTYIPWPSILYAEFQNKLQRDTERAAAKSDAMKRMGKIDACNDIDEQESSDGDECDDLPPSDGCAKKVDEDIARQFVAETLRGIRLAEFEKKFKDL